MERQTYTYLIKESARKTKDPICYSCEDSTDLIADFTAVNDQTGEEHCVCIDCLDCYTDLKFKGDVYSIDWTSRNNLLKLKAAHCEEDGGLFITARFGQKSKLAPID